MSEEQRLKKAHVQGSWIYLALLMVTLGFGVMESALIRGDLPNVDPQDPVKATLGAAATAIWNAWGRVKVFRRQGQLAHRNFAVLISVLFLLTAMLYVQYRALSAVPYPILHVLSLWALVHALVACSQSRAGTASTTDAPLDAPF